MFDATHRASILDSAGEPKRLTLSVEEAARIIGVGRTAAYEAARRGELPTRRIGRRLIVPVPALLEWLGSTPVA